MDASRPPDRRRELPVWRQAAEGIGIVTALALAVGIIGGLIALVVSLIF